MTRLSKFVTKIFKITGFLCFSFPVYASNVCDDFYKEPVVKTKVNYGNVTFKSVPKSEILNYEKLKNPMATLGFTLANFSIEYDFDLEKYQVDGGVCLVLSKLNFVIGYKNIDVLIDDKYKQNSCEYNAVKEHEQGHINIYKNELKYYGKLITNELKDIAFYIKPMFFQTSVSGKKMENEIQNAVFENQNIKLLKNKLKQTLIAENQNYDSSEEYKRVKNLCDGW